MVSSLTLTKSPLKIDEIPVIPNTVVPTPTLDEPTAKVLPVATTGDWIVPLTVNSNLLFGSFPLKIWVVPIPTLAIPTNTGLNLSESVADTATCTFWLSSLITWNDPGSFVVVPIPGPKSVESITMAFASHYQVGYIQFLHQIRSND